MKDEGTGDGRIAEIFSAAHHLREVYGNTSISPTNGVFDVRRGTIANANSKAVTPEVVLGAIAKLETESSYEHGPRCATQIRLQTTVFPRPSACGRWAGRTFALHER